MDHFLTTYNKDYTRKKLEATKRFYSEQEYKDPISEGFRNYLKLKRGKADLKPKEEYADDYLEKFKEIYPKLGLVYFQNPLNEPLLERDFQMEDQTVYQVDYCDQEKDKALVDELKRKETVVLPNDWVIPLTTAAQSYRDPRILQENALDVVKPIRPPAGDWGSSEAVSDILQVITGKSEYQGVIGQLGDIIIKDQIHGKIVHPKCTCTLHNLKKESK